jgi:glutaredoxin-like protein NrdH
MTPRDPAGAIIGPAGFRPSTHISGNRCLTEDLELTMTPFGGHGSTSDITVYTKPGCVQCRTTIHALERAGLTFTTVDISADTHARDSVMSLGYLQTPVVTVGTNHWSGFRPDRIAELTDGAA